VPKNLLSLKELYKFSFVNGVFFASNFVTVTKTEDADWNDVEPILKEFVKGAVESEYKVQAEEQAEAKLILKVPKPRSRFNRY
jgi:hypothetical protein